MPKNDKGIFQLMQVGKTIIGTIEMEMKTRYLVSWFSCFPLPSQFRLYLPCQSYMLNISNKGDNIMFLEMGKIINKIPTIYL